MLYQHRLLALHKTVHRKVKHISSNPSTLPGHINRATLSRTTYHNQQQLEASILNLMSQGVRQCSHTLLCDCRGARWCTLTSLIRKSWPDCCTSHVDRIKFSRSRLKGTTLGPVNCRQHSGPASELCNKQHHDVQTSSRSLIHKVHLMGNMQHPDQQYSCSRFCDESSQLYKQVCALSAVQLIQLMLFTYPDINFPCDVSE